MAEIDWEKGQMSPPAAAEPDWEAGAMAPPSTKGFMSDVGTALKQGVQQLPGAVTGLADIPLSLAGMDRPVSRAADRLGEATGFQPGKWAQQTAQQYSPETQAARAEIDAAWADPNAGALDVAGAYLRNPRATALNVVQSVPSIVAGGVAGRVAGLAGLASAPARAAVGEGALIAGQSMDQIDDSVDPQKAAAAALVAGAGGAAAGALGGQLAARMGVRDIDTTLAGGAAAQTARAPGVVGRVAAGAGQEAAEEGAQSALEQGAQNWAEDRALTEGMARNVVEGALAGGVMGAGAGAVPPSRRMGLDPNAGPLSAAAATAVDTGATLALPAPTVTVDGEGTARTAEQRQAERDEPGPLETGAVGQGRNSDEVPAPAPFPAPELQPALEYAAPPALGYDTAPTDTLIADADGTVRQEMRAEAINRAQVQGEQQAGEDAEAQRRADLGLPPLTPVEPVRPGQARGETLELGADGVARPVDLLPEPTNRIRAGRAAREAGPGHEAVQVEGGWNVRRIEGAVDGATGEPGAVAGGDRLAWRGDTGRGLGYPGRAQPGDGALGRGAGVRGVEPGPASGGPADLAARGAGGRAVAVARPGPDDIGYNLPKNTTVGGSKEIEDLFRQAEGRRSAVRRAIRFAVVQQDEAARLKAATGLDLQGYRHTVDSHGLQHAIKRHGDAAGEAARGQVAVTAEDAARIPEIVAQPDTVELAGKDATGNDLIRYSKAFEGTTFYVEEVRRGRQELAAKTLWKTRTTPRATPEGGVAQTPETVGSNPPQRAEIVPAARESAPAVPASPVDAAAHQAATSPTNELPEPSQAQKEAGNYKKGRLKLHGLDISIENPKGSTRSGTDPNGQPWSVSMPAHYGYVRRTTGADGDQVDVYIGEHPDSPRVFVVDQRDADSGKFDEHKVIMGARNAIEARRLYNAGFSDGRGAQRMGGMTTMSVDEFKAWLKDGNTTKPAAAAPALSRLDHGELNIPGRTSGINAALDRAKAQQASEQRAERKTQAAQTREDKARAKELFAQHGESIIAKNGDRFGRAKLAKTLDAMVKWEPRKFIQLAERFQQEQAAEAPAAPGTTSAPAGREVSRDAGQRGEGMSEFRARQVQRQLAKANPGTTYTVEEDASVKNGWVVVGRRGGTDAPMSRAAVAEADIQRAQAQHHTEIDQAVAETTGRWKNAPRVVAVANPRSIGVHPRVREHYTQPGAIVPNGSYYGGTVYLFTDHLQDAAEAQRVLFHEALGHAGLRGFFGPALNGVLDQVATARADAVQAKAAAYGLDVTTQRQRRLAAEEVLAEMAEQNPQLPLVRRAVAAIRTWLRENIPALRGLALSDGEIVRNFLLPARGFIERGPAAERVPSNAVPASARSTSERAVDQPMSSIAAGSAMGTLSPAQEAAWKRVAQLRQAPTLRERFDAMRANLGTKLRQGIVDQFAPIKEVSQEAYVQARLSKGSDGTMEAALLYGKPFLRDGAADVDVQDGGFAQVLASLKGEHDRFLMWVAAQRAERLQAEGKENLFTSQDISALKTLNAGRFDDGTARTPVYGRALRDLNAFNDSVLAMAEQSGLIDPEARALFKDQPYVPFYRVMEEGDMKGPKFSSGLVNQQAFKKLKGGSEQLNADLLENMLLNWSHLYSAAARNRAAQATMDAAERLAVAYQVPEGTKGAVRVMRGGTAQHWAVEDPHLLEAITALNYAPSPLMKPLAAMKNILTYTVTVNPTFKIRNLIRDSLSAISQADLSYNPLANVGGGWKATAKDSQIYASMLASGGTIRFGTQENSARLRAQVEKLGGQVLDKDGWRKLADQVRTVWGVYEEFGDRLENVNRAALYEQLVKKGHSHAEAAFMSRDLMDFSMSGAWPLVRFLGQTVPFFNARLQGLYKLGRAAAEDPRRFVTMAAAVSLASLGLMAAYQDDDDWKKREDWDRDAYWWFKIGETAVRIPKPFELGAIGTIAERSAELMLSDEMTGKRFGQRISNMVFGTFAMDPTPQIIKPLLDVYANKDSFTGRAIEGLADQRLRPEDRAGERTTEVARFLGQLGLPDPVQLAKGEYSGLSPKQIDFLLRGYFGWVGTTAAQLGDRALRPLMDRGERPAMELRDTFLAGNFVESLPSGSSRYVTQLYDRAREVDQAYASYRDALKRGDTEKAAAIRESDGDKLQARRAVANAQNQLSKINQQARMVEASRTLSADEKRQRLDEIEERRNSVARAASVQ